jgi:hypothetical protein
VSHELPLGNVHNILSGSSTEKARASVDTMPVSAQQVARDALLDLEGIDAAALLRDVAAVLYRRVGKTKTEEIVGRLVGAAIANWDPPGMLAGLDDVKRRIAHSIAVPALQKLVTDLAEGLEG